MARSPCGAGKRCPPTGDSPATLVHFGRLAAVHLGRLHPVHVRRLHMVQSKPLTDIGRVTVPKGASEPVACPPRDRRRHRLPSIANIQGGRRSGRAVVFVDETGHTFLARLGTTWAPRGRPPVLRRVSQRRELS